MCTYVRTYESIVSCMRSRHCPHRRINVDKSSKVAFRHISANTIRRRTVDRQLTRLMLKHERSAYARIVSFSVYGIMNTEAVAIAMSTAKIYQLQVHARMEILSLKYKMFFI